MNVQVTVERGAPPSVTFTRHNTMTVRAPHITLRYLCNNPMKCHRLTGSVRNIKQFSITHMVKLQHSHIRRTTINTRMRSQIVCNPIAHQMPLTGSIRTTSRILLRCPLIIGPIQCLSTRFASGLVTIFASPVATKRRDRKVSTASAAMFHTTRIGTHRCPTRKGVPPAGFEPAVVLTHVGLRARSHRPLGNGGKKGSRSTTIPSWRGGWVPCFLGWRTKTKNREWFPVCLPPNQHVPLRGGG